MGKNKICFIVIKNITKNQMKKEPKVEPIIKQESKQDKLIEVFQKHFPQALQETEHGFLVDKEQLQRALEPKNCEVTDEALELRWVGKKRSLPFWL